MKVQKQLVSRTQKGRVGSSVRLIVDGPSSEHELVLRGRTAGQAPDIDPLVYLTDCDPSELATGQFVDAEIVGQVFEELNSQKGRKIEIDLTAISFINSDGAAILKRIEAQGAVLTGLDFFIKQVIETYEAKILDNQN